MTTLKKLIYSKLKDYKQINNTYVVCKENLLILIKNKIIKYTFIEVCAEAGLIPILLNDNNMDCCNTLKNTHNNVNIICAPANGRRS